MKSRPKLAADRQTPAWWESGNRGSSLVELVIGILLLSGMFGIGIASIRTLMLVEADASAKSRSLGTVQQFEFQLRSDVRAADVEVIQNAESYELRISNHDGTTGATWTFHPDRAIRVTAAEGDDATDSVATFRISQPTTLETSLEDGQFVITIDLGTRQYTDGQREDKGVRLQWTVPVVVIEASGVNHREGARS